MGNENQSMWREITVANWTHYCRSLSKCLRITILKIQWICNCSNTIIFYSYILFSLIPYRHSCISSLFSFLFFYFVFDSWNESIFIAFEYLIQKWQFLVWPMLVFLSSQGFHFHNFFFPKFFKRCNNKVILNKGINALSKIFLYFKDFEPIAIFVRCKTDMSNFWSGILIAAWLFLPKLDFWQLILFECNKT